MSEVKSRRSAENPKDPKRRWAVPATAATLAVGATFGLSACMTPLNRTPDAQTKIVKIEPSGDPHNISISALLGNDKDPNAQKAAWAKVQELEPANAESTVESMYVSVAYGTNPNAQDAKKEADTLANLAGRFLHLQVSTRSDRVYQSNVTPGPQAVPQGEVCRLALRSPTCRRLFNHRPLG